MPEDTKALLVAVGELSDKVSSLDEHITVSWQSVRKLKLLVWTCVGLLIAGFIATGFILDLYGDVGDSQKATCENRNEQAHAAKGLWFYILDYSEATAPEQNQRSKDFSVAMRAYVDKLYEDRDCNDLSRRYPVPDPPRIPK